MQSNNIITIRGHHRWVKLKLNRLELTPLHEHRRKQHGRRFFNRHFSAKAWQQYENSELTCRMIRLLDCHSQIILVLT